VSLRFILCPNKFRFLRNKYNVVDVVSLTPLFVKLGLGLQRPEKGSASELVMLCWPVLRLLKASRNFVGFRLLSVALGRSSEAPATTKSKETTSSAAPTSEATTSKEDVTTTAKPEATITAKKETTKAKEETTTKKADKEPMDVAV